MGSRVRIPRITTTHQSMVKGGGVYLDVSKMICKMSSGGWMDAELEHVLGGVADVI